MAMGHNEAQIRALAKGSLAITPPPEPLGPATPVASAPQVKAKRR
jgi:hypothetical protein